MGRRSGSSRLPTSGWFRSVRWTRSSRRPRARATARSPIGAKRMRTFSAACSLVSAAVSTTPHWSCANAFGCYAAATAGRSTANRRPPVTLIKLPVSRQNPVDTAELLRELRIDRDGRPSRARRGRYILAAIALVVLAAAVWFAWSWVSTPTVRTVAARAAAPAGGAGSVLDASGYVTARRQATVSAKITGKITEVLIEEGMRVA